CFDSKYKGITDDEITQQLKQFGLDNKACLYIITSLEGEATKIKDKSEDQMVIGGAILVVGCLLFFLAESTEFHINIYILSFLTLLIGTIKLVGGAIVKRKYAEILANISEQQKL
ncbi:MAG TPA: hypothetical protein VK166_02925, partial [Chitinophagaceae bacterium]|nr:hypothetical protein [Chitinophagaceae bacterium]